ncbi:hypothetical protein TNCV_1313531 [Trichonephila clavipes]|nr:hypothetical protein TNCV_1313531 [Trichonephila clavipes]
MRADTNLHERRTVRLFFLCVLRRVVFGKFSDETWGVKTERGLEFERIKEEIESLKETSRNILFLPNNSLREREKEERERDLKRLENREEQRPADIGC